jgi:hypothetical protein
VLTLPGASYLAGLHHIEKQNLSTSAIVLTVVGSNLIILILLELPLLNYTIAPEWTRAPWTSESVGRPERAPGSGHRAQRDRWRAHHQGDRWAGGLRTLSRA